MFIEQADRCQGAVCFHNKDVLYIRGIAKGDPMFGKTVINLILHLVDHDNRISGYPAFDFEEERAFNQIIREPANQFRLLQKAFQR